MYKWELCLRMVFLVDSVRGEFGVKRFSIKKGIEFRVGEYLEKRDVWNIKNE